jgi:hypothetical protein
VVDGLEQRVFVDSVYHGEEACRECLFSARDTQFDADRDLRDDGLGNLADTVVAPVCCRVKVEE